MRRLALLIPLLGLVSCRSHVQVPDAPRVYASAAEKEKVAAIADAVGSYEDGSVNEYYEQQTLRVVHRDLARMDENSPTWPDDYKQLRADMDTLVRLDKLLTRQIVL